MNYLLHHLLEASAKAQPDRPAVVDGERSLTYSELDRASNRVANLLQDVGVQRGDRVGLYLNKSIEAVIALYGVMKAGAVYVPLDPDAPVARLGYICANCGIRCLITGEEKSAMWAGLLDSGAELDALVVLNSSHASGITSPGGNVKILAEDDLESQPDSPPQIPTIDLELAYILYTSGSTGSPKGVMLTHLNALTFVNWAVDELEVKPDDRLSSHAPFHFDLSVFDLFAAASAGACLVLVPPETSYFPIEVGRFIDRYGITIWYSVPSILTMLTLRGHLETGSLPSLRTILFAGEVFPIKYLRQLTDLLPHVHFYNLYGPTETNVCTYYKVPALPPERAKPIPIGKAIANVEVFAVTDRGRLAKSGDVGELWARGTTVMQGYWGDPERTAKGLVPNPFSGPVHDPCYRTGDLVRQNPDGDYELLGRRDHQIKSRGYRIELGEIESVLYSHPDVVECAVIAVPDELITNKIRAYVVLRAGVSETDFAGHCSRHLPHYMIPMSFDLEQALPKTSTGKIDRKALES